MWIKRSELENLLHKYRSAVATEQGRTEALRKNLVAVEDQLSAAHREIGRLTRMVDRYEEDALDYRYVIDRLHAKVEQA